MKPDIYTISNAQTDFRLAESKPTARSDLAARIEVKYPIPKCDIGKIRNVLAMNCRRVVYNKEVSTVRSIYFDDPFFCSCQANIDGVGRRKKVRIRWYDTLLPDRTFIFEVKWRHSRVTGKHRIGITSSRCFSKMSYHEIQSNLQVLLPSEYHSDLLELSEATVLVEYKREHFMSQDESLRITLDYDIAFYDQYNREFISSEFGVSGGDLVVVEGKAPIGRESELSELLYPLCLRAQRNSKYVSGCRQLGLIRTQY